MTSAYRQNTQIATLTWAGLILASCCSALAQDLATGPPTGTVLSPVQCYAHSGPYSGREFDVAKEIGAGHGALLFIHQLTDNGMHTIRALDDFAAQYGILEFKSFTLLLTGDRTAVENTVQAGKLLLQMRNPIVVCLDGAEGPEKLALNRKCAQSLLMIRAGKVVKSIALNDIVAEDRERVRLWIEEVTGPLPVEPREYLQLVQSKLPDDYAALRRFVQTQSIELHRVHRELEVATRNIPKYRSRKPTSTLRRPNTRPKGAEKTGQKKPAVQRKTEK